LEQAGKQFEESALLQKDLLNNQKTALDGLDKLHNQGSQLEENMQMSAAVFREFR
jgi:hypothetical protein